MTDRLAELEYLFEDIYPEDEEIESVINTLPRYFKAACGETRYAIWCDNWDFVIKIPRYGYCSLDYCEIEMRNYETAKQYGVERICLPIEEYNTNVHGLTLYKQTRYSLSTCDAFSYKHNYERYLAKRNLPATGRNSLTRKITDGAYDGCRINEKWMARVLQLYGKKFCRSFEAWTNECRINDLHNNNTGWLNNKPILLDYAGFFE